MRFVLGKHWLIRLKVGPTVVGWVRVAHLRLLGLNLDSRGRVACGLSDIPVWAAQQATPKSGFSLRKFHLLPCIIQP